MNYLINSTLLGKKELYKTTEAKVKTNITLTDDIKNYKYIEVFYSQINNSVENSTIVYNTGSKSIYIDLLIMNGFGNSSKITADCDVLELNGTQGTLIDDRARHFNVNEIGTESRNHYLLIQRIIGYK